MLTLQPGSILNPQALCQLSIPLRKSLKLFSNNYRNSKVLSQSDQSHDSQVTSDEAEIWKKACEISSLLLSNSNLKQISIKDAKTILKEGHKLLTELQKLNDGNEVPLLSSQSSSETEKETIDSQNADIGCNVPFFTSGPLLFTSNFSPVFIPSRGFMSRTSKKTRLGKISMQDDEDTSKSNFFDKFTGQDKKDEAALKKLLSDKDLSPEQREKFKIAFGEGYLLGKNEPGKSWRNLFSLVWKICLALAFIYWAVVISLSVFGGVGRRVPFNMLKGSTHEVNPEDISVTFDDVKGVDEAKQELQDVVEFLRDPDKFTALGAKLPKGVLLVGPPGIGKTLLARAVAGEANVPFFHASGSEFDELFVGTGARRVRELFEAAKARSPCVIFIDEIDTVGAKRTSSAIHPYANQTINQLLSEMDGFAQTTGVIVVGATNRRDNLDKALLRPGRFDVEVRVSPPDFKGRKDILTHYLSKLTVVDGIEIEKLAHGTTGCTGADLENITNQAALKAAMDNAPAVNLQHLEFAKDKVFMGPAKKTRIADEECNLMTAYHEAGHTLVGYYTKYSTPINKVTIIPRGMSLGHTSFVPDKEQYSLSKCELMAKMDVAMGGRAAEAIIYGEDKVTTGAGSDFNVATSIATAMVKQYGMSEKVGFRTFDNDSFDGGLSMVKVNEVSPGLTELIDNEIQRLLKESYERASNILKLRSKEHIALSKALMKYETLDLEEIKAIVGDRMF